MARITVKDCLENAENRFALVHMAAKRVRQIREGSDYLVNSPKNEDIVISLREIAAGKIGIKIPDAVEPKAVETVAVEEAEAGKETASE
ncbi:MAG: DNA-directed RNA polymerase subunit omega [Desulfobacterales bacterium]|nr:DNA-directed RNA polymerase subunit omega [Desulfobacterales bacterium]